MLRQSQLKSFIGIDVSGDTQKNPWIKPKILAVKDFEIQQQLHLYVNFFAKQASRDLKMGATNNPLKMKYNKKNA